MVVELRSRAKKFAAAAGIILAAASYVTLSARQFLAAHYSDTPDVEHLGRAARLDPSDANIQYQMGRYQLVMRQSPQEALAWLRRATELDGHAAKYWIDSAIAEQLLGNADAEKVSLRRALEADPGTPDTAWQAANLYLAMGSTDDAMRQFRTVLQNDPPRTNATIETCWKIKPDAGYLLAQVVPAAAYPAFLDFLLSKTETVAANEVWERIVAQQQRIERRDLFDYLRYLFGHHEPERAALVWQQAADLSDLAAYQPSSENLLVNGDFSLDILNNGFDWRHREVHGVSLSLDPSEGHSSARSLRITLDGPGINDAGIGQVVAVEPNHSYEFSAFYKAQEMDGAGAMAFGIHDLYGDTALYTGEDLRDVDFWKKTGGSFVTGPETHAVLLRINRVPAGSPIRGKLWIDGLRITRSDVVPNQEAH
jgi:hypothetical protein